MVISGKEWPEKYSLLKSTGYRQSLRKQVAISDYLGQWFDFFFFFPRETLKLLFCAIPLWCLFLHSNYLKS